MATGYTYAVEEGTITELAPFILQCARAFAVMQRDEPMSVPLKHRKMDSYAERRLAESQKELEVLKSLSDEECTRRAKKQAADTNKSNKESLAKIKTELERYKLMLEKVRAWAPPTADHHPLKAFMIQQLVDSMKHSDITSYYDKVVEAKSGKAWRQEQISMTLRDIERSSKDVREEIERVNSTNDWVDALYESLGLDYNKVVKNT